jgi:hypothetical protein
MDNCIHELPIAQCSHCKEAPFGINKIVYVTKGGLALHNYPKCETLSSGQDEADAKGMEIHPINPFGWLMAATLRKHTDKPKKLETLLSARRVARLPAILPLNNSKFALTTTKTSTRNSRLMELAPHISMRGQHVVKKSRPISRIVPVYQYHA